MSSDGGAAAAGVAAAAGTSEASDADSGSLAGVATGATGVESDTIGETVGCATLPFACGAAAGAGAVALARDEACAGNARDRCAVTAMPPAISTTDIAMIASPNVFNQANRDSRRTSLSTRHFHTGAADAPSGARSGAAS